jgi:1,4-dihydroxy-6-naphthoate synthase
MSSPLSLAFSPCPNDTFIFDAMVHQKIDTEGLTFDFHMEDVESLNHLAMKGTIDVCKISYHAWIYVTKKYSMLNSGSALGYRNGPLVISREKIGLEDLEDLVIAVPGEFTTAHLLLKIASPRSKMKRIMVFSEIEDAVLNGTVDAGVIIHENRFTYEQKGLHKVADLGEYWEGLTHCPIPLGGIAARKGLGFDVINKLNRIMRHSVLHAMGNPESAMGFVRENAREMDEDVMKKHIGLYVNDFTVDIGSEGRKAVQKLTGLADEMRISGNGGGN